MWVGVAVLAAGALVVLALPFRTPATAESARAGAERGRRPAPPARPPREPGAGAIATARGLPALSGEVA